MSKLMLSKKQRNLLMFSESIKSSSFNNLHNYLLQHDSISFHDIKKNRKLKNITSYLDDLLLESQLEWEVYKKKPFNDLGKHYKKFRRKCDLCGKRPIKYEHAIQNKMNKKKLIIGSECTKEFQDEVMGFLKHNRKQSQVAARRLDLEEKFPNVRKLVDNGLKFPRESLVILPIGLNSTWQNEILGLRFEYNKYINQKSTSTKEIKEKWINVNHFKKEIVKYINNYKNKPNIPDGKIVKWLYENKQQDVIDMIMKNNGEINWGILHRIHEPDLMQKTLISLSNEIFKENNMISLKSVNPNNRRVNIEISDKNNILKGSMLYDDLILEWGGLLFEKANAMNVNTNELFNQLTPDLNTKIMMLESIEAVYRRNGLIRTMEAFYRSSNEVVFKQVDTWFVLNSERLIRFLKSKYFSRDISFSDYDTTINRYVKEKYDQTSIKEYYELKKELDIDNYYEPVLTN